MSSSFIGRSGQRRLNRGNRIRIDLDHAQASSNPALTCNTVDMGEAQGPRQASIPRWQQNDYRSSDSPNGESTPPESSKSTEPPPPRAALLEQASKFLQEDEIKDAPTDRKVAFLESKGLTEEEVQRLLVLPSDTVDGEAQKEAAIEETVRYTRHIFKPF